MKRNTMVQWMNLHQNRTRLLLLCEKSGAIFLILVGLTADRLADSPAGRLAVRRNTGRFGVFLNSLQITSLGFSRHLKKVQCYYSVTNAFQSVFSGKVYCEVYEAELEIAVSHRLFSDQFQDLAEQNRFLTLLQRVRTLSSHRMGCFLGCRTHYHES